jgi:hypothetical protein
VLSSFEKMDPSIVVPGHGRLGQAEIARSVREYFADVQARVRKTNEDEGIEIEIEATATGHLRDVGT